MRVLTGLAAGLVSCVLAFFVGVASTQYCPYVKRVLNQCSCSKVCPCVCPCVEKDSCGCHK